MTSIHTKQKRKARRRPIKTKAKPTAPLVILEMLVGSELRRWTVPKHRVHRYLARYEHRGFLVTPIENGQ